MKTKNVQLQDKLTPQYSRNFE